MTKIYIPLDLAAVAMGADRLAAAVAKEAAARGQKIEIVRNGSRGMLWLEPLIEVETPAGRVGYGPAKVKDVASLFDAGFLTGGAHPLNIGVVDEHPWMKRQNRVTFVRCGVIDPLSVAEYEAHEG
jgi:formate dehydrogenase iron-sulfur subunit